MFLSDSLLFGKKRACQIYKTNGDDNRTVNNNGTNKHIIIL